MYRHIYILNCIYTGCTYIYMYIYIYIYVQTYIYTLYVLYIYTGCTYHLSIFSIIINKMSLFSHLKTHAP